MNANPEPLVTGVDFVIVHTRDFEKAVDFYGNVLGIPLRKRWGDLPAQEFQAGNLTIAVLDPSSLGQIFQQANAIALQVPDVQAARERIEAAGIDFKMDNIDSGVCHMAFCADPDGNPLILHHRYAPGG